jgi:histidine triad (HIT) family protein
MATVAVSTQPRIVVHHADSMDDCLFCKILAGKIPARTVHEDALCIGFADLNPQAPLHVLFIPRRHVASADELEEGDQALVGQLAQAAAKHARAQGVAKAGYRLVVNTNADAGQTVFHLHLHLLAGRTLTWPPG